MHDLMYAAAVTWVAVLILPVLLLVVRAPEPLTRILAVDTMAILLTALLVLLSLETRSAHYLDAALVLALLAFSGTLAAVRYHRQRNLFS